MSQVNTKESITILNIAKAQNPIIAQYLQSIPAGFPSPAADFIQD